MIERLERWATSGGAFCNAAVSYPDDVVRCGEPAVGLARIDGKDHPVCREHFASMEREMFQVARTPEPQ